VTVSTMQKQYAGNALAFDTSLAGGDPTGQEQAPANRALASVELTLLQADADLAGLASLALTGGAFVFEPNWASPAVDLGALNTGLLAADLTGPIAAEFASLLGSADGGSQSGSADIPIWGLTSDDFSFI
jgi:hypothetical protein